MGEGISTHRDKAGLGGTRILDHWLSFSSTHIKVHSWGCSVELPAATGQPLQPAATKASSEDD